MSRHPPFRSFVQTCNRAIATVYRIAPHSDSTKPTKEGPSWRNPFSQGHMQTQCAHYRRPAKELPDGSSPFANIRGPRSSPAARCTRTGGASSHNSRPRRTSETKYLKLMHSRADHPLSMGRVTGSCDESARRQRSSVQPQLGWTESFPLSKRPDDFYGVMFYAAVKAYQSFERE